MTQGSHGTQVQFCVFTSFQQINTLQTKYTLQLQAFLPPFWEKGTLANWENLRRKICQIGNKICRKIEQIGKKSRLKICRICAK